MTVFACILFALMTQTAEKPGALPVESTAAQTSRGNSPVSQSLTGEFQDDAVVRKAFKDEFNKPAYRRLRTRLKRLERPEVDINVKAPGWWRRFWAWVGSWFTLPRGGGLKIPGFGFGGFGGLSVLVWCGLGILIAVLVAFIIKSASVRVGDEDRRKRLAGHLDSDALQPSTPPGEIPSDEYMHRAIELAREGDHRRALRQLVLGGMSWIERAGLIRFRKGLTNRDYVRAVYRRETQRKRFAGIILDFEKVYFGRRDASETQFQECLSDYKSAFGQPLDAEAAMRQEAAGAEAPAVEPGIAKSYVPTDQPLPATERESPPLSQQPPPDQQPPQAPEAEA